MQTASSAFERELRKLVTARIAELTDSLSAGLVQTFDEYKYQAGRIASLKDVFGLCDDAQAELDKR